MEIRFATSADDARLTRLAERDSSEVPAGPLLIAEEDGELLAALNLETGAIVADPFASTDRIVAALHAYSDPRRHVTRWSPILAPWTRYSGRSPIRLDAACSTSSSGRTDRA